MIDRMTRSLVAASLLLLGCPTTDEPEAGSSTGGDDSTAHAETTGTSGTTTGGATPDAGTGVVATDSSSSSGESGSTSGDAGSSTGPASCPPGEQDHDDDGVCEPACDAETCGDHGTCDDSTGLIQCDCEGFYTGDFCELCAPAALIDDAFGNDDLATGAAE